MAGVTQWLRANAWGTEEMTDRRGSLGTRARHFLEEGQGGDEALIGEYLGYVVGRLFELSDESGDVADELFELALVLSTFDQALSPDGATALRLVLKKRPYTLRGGRHPDSSDLIWRKHQAARIAEGSAANNQEERIEEALATMRERGRASGLTINGIKSMLTKRRKDREARRGRAMKKTP